MRGFSVSIIIILSFVFLDFVQAGELKTNALRMTDAPTWVTVVRLDGIVSHIQSILEWDIRRIQVYWYTDQSKFEKVHGFGPTVLAISRKADNTVHVGPRVTNANFDGVFTHELVAPRPPPPMGPDPRRCRRPRSMRRPGRASLWSCRRRRGLSPAAGGHRRWPSCGPARPARR